MICWCRWGASSGMQLIAYGTAFLFGLLEELDYDIKPEHLAFVQSATDEECRLIYQNSVWRWTHEPANPPKQRSTDRCVDGRQCSVQRRNSLWAWYWGQDLQRAVGGASLLKPAVRKSFAMRRACACNSADWHQSQCCMNQLKIWLKMQRLVF